MYNAILLTDKTRLNVVYKIKTMLKCFHFHWPNRDETLYHYFVQSSRIIIILQYFDFLCFTSVKWKRKWNILWKKMGRNVVLSKEPVVPRTRSTRFLIHTAVWIPCHRKRRRNCGTYTVSDFCKLHIHEFTLTFNLKAIVSIFWLAVLGEGSKPGIWPEPRELPRPRCGMK